MRTAVLMGMLLVGSGALGQGLLPARGGAITTVSELTTCSAPSANTTVLLSTDFHLYVCNGTDWLRVRTDADINGDVDVAVRGIVAQAASGEYGFRCLHDGCRIDVGASTNDYFYASNGTIIFNSTRHGDITVETIGSVQGWVNIFGPRIFPGSSLATCNSSTEGRLGALSGSSLSAQSRICGCVSDGAGTPSFSWVNLGCPNTAGTSTTCPACP